MRWLLVTATTIGVFLPHLWSVLVILRAVPLIRAATSRLEPLLLPAIFALYRLVENLGRDPWFGLGEMVYVLVVGFSLLVVLHNYTVYDRNAFLKGILLGSTILAVFSTLNFFDQIYLIKPWTAYPSEARILKRNAFEALSSNAIVTKDLGYVGPGVLKASMRLRHIDTNNRELKLPVSFVRKSSPITPSAFCTVTTKETTCTITVKLERRERTVLWLGGWDSWQSKNSSILEASALRLFYLEPPPIAQILFNSGRSAGFTFNPNALGLASLVCILLVALLNRAPWHTVILSCIPLFVLLLQSGSRASLAGLVLFILILLIRHPELKRSVGYMTPIIILLVIFWGFRSTPEPTITLPRILNPFEDVYRESRVSLYVAVIERIGLSFIGTRDIGSLLHDIQSDLGLGTLEHTHSLWLQIYIASGILGLLIFLAGFILVEYRLSQKQLHVAQAAFFSLYCVSFFDYFAFYPPYYILLFGLGYLALSPKAGSVHYD